MTSSKLLTLTLTVAALGLGACSTESRKKADVIQGKSSDFPADSGTNFRVDALTIDTVTPTLNAYGMPKQKLFNFKACLQDAGGGALLPDISFSIATENGEPLTRKTDQKGCLNWDETHSFSLLADESYLKLTRVFTPQSIYRGRVYATVALNLWADKGDMIDLRYKTLPPGVPLVDGGAVGLRSTRWTTLNRTPLKINVDTIAFDFRGLNYKQYEIRPDLGLTIAHDYEVRLKPTVIRKVIASAGKTESFVGGRMKVYFALFRERRGSADAYDVKNLISSSEFVLEDVNNSGTFIGDVTLKFKDVSDLSSRTAVLVSLVPIDDQIDGLPEMNFKGVMKPGRVSTLALRPSDISARNAAEKAASLEQTKAIFRPFASFVEKTGFKVIEIESLTKKKIGVLTATGWKFMTVQEMVEQNIDGKIGIGLPNHIELCDILYADDENQITDCRRHGARQLVYDRREFLEEVRSTPEQVGITTVETLKMEMSIAKAKSVATSSVGKISAGGGISAGLELGKTTYNPPTVPGTDIPNSGGGNGLNWNLFNAGFGAKINVGGEYSVTRQWTTTDSAANTVSVSTNQTITSEGNSFRFKALTRRCLIISERVSLKMAAGLTEAEASRHLRGAVICEKSPQERFPTESYYLLGQNIGVGGSPFSDSESNVSSSWRTFVRGRETVLLLYNLLQNSRQKIIVEKMFDADQERENFGSLTTESFPGMMFIEN